MPTYDYVCNDCNHRFEEFQSITALPLEECPQCSGPVQRQIGSGLGLIFKGSGFYITDYKNNNGNSSKSSSKPGDKSDSPTNKSESKGSDSKKEPS